MNDDFGVCYSSSSVMGQFKIDKKKNGSSMCTLSEIAPSLMLWIRLARSSKRTSLSFHRCGVAVCPVDGALDCIKESILLLEIMKNAGSISKPMLLNSRLGQVYDNGTEEKTQP
jgi:hypothetical protein